MKKETGSISRRSMVKNIGAISSLMASGTVLSFAPKPQIKPVQKKSGMKITGVETIMTGSDIYVKITTDSGITGYGDATNHFIPYAVEGMLKDLKSYLIGEDPHQIEYLWQSCFRRVFMRGGPATGSAIGGIDQALWDIKGKAYNAPVYQLLGGLARTRVRVYGHVTGQTAAEAANQAKQRVARGVTAIRFRAFHSYDSISLHDHKKAVEQQIEYLAAIREAVGKDIDLILECHGRYDPEWALKLASLAREYNPFMIEDPVRHENPEALKWLREHTDIPLAIGERYHNKWDCREVTVNQYVNYLRPDINHCGGISEMKKIAALAEVFYINLIPHNNAGPLGTAATMHAALNIPNLTMIEAPWANGYSEPKIVKPYPLIENGFALPLDRPGLGVIFDEAEAIKVPFKEPAPQIRLNAEDGSVMDF